LCPELRLAEDDYAVGGLRRPRDRARDRRTGTVRRREDELANRLHRALQPVADHLVRDPQPSSGARIVELGTLEAKLLPKENPHRSRVTELFHALAVQPASLEEASQLARHLVEGHVPRSELRIPCAVV